MHVLRTRRRTWRMQIGLLACLAIGFVSALLPSSASALITYQHYDAPLSYTGWVQLVDPCPAGMVGVTCTPGSAAAWRWNGYSWSQQHIMRDQMVYVAPFSGQWRWVWTQRTGWLAITGQQFLYASASSRW